MMRTGQQRWPGGCDALVPLDGEHVVAELGAEDKLLIGDLGLGRLRSVDDELVVLHA